MAAKISKLITAAIDFGTTYSGYAYGFKCDLETDRPTIIANSWSKGSHKAPTSVLFNGDRSFNSFGYDAEENYSDLCAEGSHESYYFFQRFKMTLHGAEALSRSTVVKEEGGKIMPAITVFAGAIRFLKDHLLESVRKKVDKISEDDVLWVLTVPAIWEEPAKQFMREAAEKAGIQHDQLIIALEPECASVYCQSIPTEAQRVTGGTQLRIAEPNSQFMVLDLGGGTADITVQERQADKTLKELHAASGGAWGGTKVDKEFVQLLSQMFGGEEIGADIFKTFRTSNMEDYVDLFREFEVKKRGAKLQGQDKTTIKIPVALIDVFNEKTENTLKQVVSTTSFGDKITLAADKMRLHADVMKALFTPAVDSVVNHLRELFKLPSVNKVDTILMVGGFSASTFVQDAVQKAFPSKKLFVPGQPDMAVLMGAVMFGNNPDVVSSRRSRFTYGTDSVPKFKPGEHDESKKKVFDGIERCEDVFYALVKTGDTLTIGVPTKTTKYTPVYKDQKSMTLSIYASIEKSPKYVTDRGCQCLGKIKIDMPDIEAGMDRRVAIKLNFAGTELEVEAYEETTKKTYKTRVDFLN